MSVIFKFEYLENWLVHSPCVVNFVELRLQNSMNKTKVNIVVARLTFTIAVYIFP